MLSTESIAKNSRLSLVRVINRSRAAHIGSSLSIVDIASVLYGSVAKLDSSSFHSDLVLISKGHAAAGVYSVMAQVGMIDPEWLQDYSTDGALLGGHISHHNVENVPLSTGSLGHALPVAVGMAIGKKRNNRNGIVYVVLSDGECDEGSNWEAALLANHLKLDNLIVIVDRNRLQSIRGTEETVALEPLADKWNAFGWIVSDIDGHDHDQLKMSLLSKSTGPKVLIANTLKGKGVSFMENDNQWHYKPTSPDQYEIAISELKSPR